MAKRECMNVKIDAELVMKAKVVAAARRITLTDYISELLRELIPGDLARVAAGLATTGATIERTGPRAAGDSTARQAPMTLRS